MTSRNTLVFGLVTAVLFAPAARGQSTDRDVDALLVREDTHDILVLRPWLADPPEAGVWLWPAPAGTQVAVRPEIEIDALRTAVWMGHIPLSRSNADRLRTSCELAEYLDLALLPVRAMGTVGSLAEFEGMAARENLPLRDTDRQLCSAILASGAYVAAVGWSVADGAQVGRNHAGLTPLAAVVLTAPGFWDELNLGGEDPQRGCIGRLIAVAARPVVPAPDDGDRWEVSLLVGRSAVPALDAARIAGADGVDAAWCATALNLQRCDGTTALHPALLNPVRDLRGPAARTAASWCGLRPGPNRASALRQALVDTTRIGLEAAFALWAWARQRVDDVIPVLESWGESADPVVRSEALLGLAEVDSTNGLRRDLAILAAFLEPSREIQATVNFIGPRVVANVDRDGQDELLAIANDGGGWNEWSFGEQVTRIRRNSRHGGPPAYLPGSDELTAGAWAVAALAVFAHPDALVTLTDALVTTALLKVAATANPRRGCSIKHGLSSDFWNGYQILMPRESQRLWPTLYRLEVALADQPRTRDGLLRMALRDPRLSDVAATVLLASLATWYPDSEAMAVAILDSATTARDEHRTRFFDAGRRGHDSEIEVHLPWAAAGAAYVLAQRGVTEPILAALDREPSAVLRAELIFALALAEHRDAAATAAIDTWRAEIDIMAHDDPSWLVAELARQRIVKALASGYRNRRPPYAARYATDFRTRWQR